MDINSIHPFLSIVNCTGTGSEMMKLAKNIPRTVVGMRKSTFIVELVTCITSVSTRSKQGGPMDVVFTIDRG
jgi:hypothetical protein